MEKRFNENAPAIIKGLVAELVNAYLQKARGQ
jgi:V/A-type H+-transporting ATPase subunit G/H/F-type H+-transporting ATPase subunit b